MVLEDFLFYQLFKQSSENHFCALNKSETVQPGKETLHKCGPWLRELPYCFFGHEWVKVTS